MYTTLYTWMDVESILHTDENKARWPQHWKALEVYSKDLIIYVESDIELSEDSSVAFLTEAFNSLYDKERNIIKLLLHDMEVIYETYDKEDDLQPNPLPLFGDSAVTRTDIKLVLNDLPVPIIAFHSYKGGVGRTLSALALVRELSNNKEKPFKTLLIDADIEAPGLSWLADESNHAVSPGISYLDILSILHDCPAQGNDVRVVMEKAITSIADIISRTLIQIPADEIITEHYFVNAYRMEAQLLGHFPNPSDIISMPNRAFVITDFLSKIGEKLGVDAIVMDLRAGFSELSAPFLFDSRVCRVFVTSTSYQSTRGTKLLLNKIMNSSFSPIESDDYLSPTILLTMIPVTFRSEQISDIQNDLLSVFSQSYDDDDKTGDNELSDVIIDSKFDSQLLHLESISHICELIRGTDLQRKMSLLRARIFHKECTTSLCKTSEMPEESDRNHILEKVHEYTKTATAAEGSASVQDMLITTSLNKLITRYNKELPRLVILGPKGSGKTYLYKQLLGSMYWDAFITSIRGGESQHNIILAPLLATKNRSAIHGLLNKSFAELTVFLEANDDFSTEILSRNESSVENAEQIMVTDWIKIAAESYCLAANRTLANLNEHLTSKGKQLVFLVDGIDDIFNDTIDTEKSKVAIRELCQNFVNQIANYQNIGVIVFARNDMLQDAILTNIEQFKKQYEPYALKWELTEALRLAVWVLSRVGFLDWKNMEQEIGKINHEKAVEMLQSFWGKKLGSDKSNEAHTARWVLAALSDFNGLLQARDIIRFLEYSTESPSQNVTYNDGRYLMPADIRRAIIPCSKKKYEEVKTEMKKLSAVLESLDNVPEADKIFPLSSEIISYDERKVLESLGYLKEHQNNYYLPEIIRHAIGYRYITGGRAKVLSLLKVK